jgi:hypothetical protein
VIDEVDEDLAVLGISPEKTDDTEESSDESLFEVWEENWDAVQVFVRLTTQWNFAGMGAHIGLNYQSVDFVFALLDIKNRKEVFDDLRVMELAALAELNSKKD